MNEFGPEPESIPRGAGQGDVISLEGVRKRFGEFAAVHEASFGIARGEFFSMLGPSGCGKTTTLRMIAGFESPSDGRILLDGDDVSSTPPYRRNVNTVFQQYALFPHMTVADNVAFGLRSRKVPSREVDSRVAAILETVRMSEFAARKPAQLSGGQQQRVALARALVNRPSALLLDEPLAALDLKLRQTMQIELKRIQRETEVTFIFVTHDQQEALTMSDRIAVMSAGWVEQIGTPTEIYHRPNSPFVAEFIGEANLLSGRRVGGTADRWDVEVGGGLMGVDAAGRSGDDALVMVRPERVRLDEADGGGTGLPVTVTDVVFRGPMIQVVLRCADGSDLVAHLTDSPGAVALRPGDRRIATWDDDAAFLVPPSSRAAPDAAPAAPDPELADTKG